ncbi:MAG: transposase, partial [Bacteroidota bacterium]|nr:transposase [Bacteroidota bacterium]
TAVGIEVANTQSSFFSKVKPLKKLTTYFRTRHIKNCLMLLQYKIALRKRTLIETVNDQLKNMCQIEHTPHRSFDNFITNLLS